LLSQNATLKKQGTHRKYLPYVFTEQGIFYDRQIFDAYVFVANLIKFAKKSICLMNYEL